MGRSTGKPRSQPTPLLGLLRGGGSWIRGLQLPSGTFFPFGPLGDLTAPPFVLLPRDSFNDFEPVEAFIIAPPAANGAYRVVVSLLDPLRLRLEPQRVASPGADSQRPQSGVARQRAGLYASPTVLACGQHH